MQRLCKPILKTHAFISCELQGKVGRAFREGRFDKLTLDQITHFAQKKDVIAMLRRGGDRDQMIAMVALSVLNQKKTDPKHAEAVKKIFENVAKPYFRAEKDINALGVNFRTYGGAKLDAIVAKTLVRAPGIFDFVDKLAYWDKEVSDKYYKQGLFPEFHKSSTADFLELNVLKSSMLKLPNIKNLIKGSSPASVLGVICSADRSALHHFDQMLKQDSRSKNKGIMSLVLNQLSKIELQNPDRNDCLAMYKAVMLIPTITMISDELSLTKEDLNTLNLWDAGLRDALDSNPKKLQAIILQASTEASFAA